MPISNGIFNEGAVIASEGIQEMAVVDDSIRTTCLPAFPTGPNDPSSRRSVWHPRALSVTSGDGRMTETEHTADALRPFVPRLVREWAAEYPDYLHRQIDGTLVYTDLSGFTAMSEKLGRLGRLGAEELTVHLDVVFGALLDIATTRGGDLLKFGGDALLLFFWGEHHAVRAVTAAHEMRAALRSVGQISTEAGRFRLRMSVGIHSGGFDFFLVGGSHRELVITGHEATVTNEMEETAEAGEILLSPGTASWLRPLDVGRCKGTGVLLARKPRAPEWAVAMPPRSVVDPAAFVPVALRPRLADAERYGEHRPATIAFIHFVGVDTMLRRDGAGAAARELDRFLRTVQDVFSEHRVTFLTTDIYDDGGKVFAQSGAPVSHGNDEDRMLRALRQLVDTDLPFTLRIGVNRGTVFAGEIGTTTARTYTAMGDAVNTAARVMGKAAAGQILATLPVLSRSRTRFATQALEPFSVKGKTEPLATVAVGPVSSSVRADTDRDAAALVGRDLELAKLLNAADQASSGTGAFFRIVADPGMGKTRLVEELLTQRVSTRAVRVQCDEYSAATPFAAAHDLIGHALGIDETDAVGRGDQLLQLITRSAAPLLPWTPLIARVLGAEVPATAEADALDPQFAGQRLRAATAQLLQSVLSVPQIWVIEDAHWADAATLQLLDAVAAGVHSLPLLVVFTMRPPVEDHPNAETLTLAAIGEREVRRLMGSALGRAVLPHEAEELLARCGGNPLFVLEVVRSGRTDDPPEALEGIVNARLDALPAPARRAVRDLSVLGERTSTRVALALVPDFDAVASDLDEVLEIDSDRVAFRHGLFREIAYAGLPFRRRRLLHQRAGHLLEDTNDADRNPSALSLHFHLGRELEPAWRWSVEAARRAVESYSFATAADLYDRALQTARQLPSVSSAEVLEVVRSRGEALRRSGQLAKAAGMYRQARRMTASPYARAELLTLQASAVFMQGHPASALRLLRTAAYTLSGLDDPEARRLRGRVLRGQASISSLSFGRHRKSLSLAREAARLAIEVGDVAGAALAQLEVLSAAAHAGEPRDDDERLGVKLAETTSDLRLGASLIGQVGLSAYMNGRWDEAVVRLERCHELAAAAGFTLASANARKNLGEILSNQGRYDEAALHLEEAVEIARAAGSWQAAEYAAHLGRLRVRAGSLQEGRRLLDEVVQEARRLRLPAVEAEALAFVAEHCLATEEPAAAVDLTADLLSRRDGTRRARLLRIRAEALRRVGDRDAESAALDAASAASDEHDLFERALALQLVARPEADAEAAALLQQLGVRSPQGCPPALA
jgi:class 3 adenylate cyclase/predicted ATPase